MSHSPSRRILISLAAFVSGVLVVFLVGEAFLRMFPKPVNDSPPSPPNDYCVPDDTYGWLAQDGYRFRGELLDKCGIPSPLSVSFGKNGFRRWGNPAATDRRKVLFLGDSYTAGVHADDDHLFYKRMADSLNIEVFACGAAGYGNAQQYMLLEKHLGTIKPDLVVWQVCSNDFTDNDWELELSATERVRKRRPYVLEDGSTVYRLAAEYPRNVKPYSHFLYFLLKRVAEAKGAFDKPPAAPAEKRIVEQNLGYEPFARSVRMTGAVFKKTKALLAAGKSRLLVFDADGLQPQHDHYTRLCRENGIAFVAGLPAFLQTVESSGACIRAADGRHWNNRGNELTAAFLRPFVAEELAR